MCDSAPAIRNAIATIVRALEATILEAPEALTLLGEFAEIERLAAAGRILAIKSLADTNAHHDLGYRTPAELVASRTRGSLSEAIGAVAAAGALDTLPALRRQLLSGKVASLQAGLIAQAASADPSADLVASGGGARAARASS